MNAASEKLADRIRKLLALAGNNPSEAEAAAAMERAYALMTEHNLSMAQVSTLGTDDERIHERHEGQKARQTWARSIWGGVARLNFCRYFYTRSLRSDLHSLVGTRANVAATQVMALYLVETVERLARECEGISGVHDHHGFKVGCADRLVERLNDLQEQRIAAENAKRSPSTSSTLPTIAGLYDTHALANGELLTKLGIKTRRGSSSTTSQDRAYARGKAAGDGIGLNTQVGSQRRLAAPK